MYCIKQLKNDLFWVGGSERRLSLFENVMPVPNGISYNSYLILDEKTVLMDTVDQSISRLFFENISSVLKERPLDYLVITHMEPDHCANLAEVILRYPHVKLVGNSKTMEMIKQFFDFDISGRNVVVADGETLCTGRHNLTFTMAPMVHWPEAMVCYDNTDKVLFSADAFGTFGALSGNIFADELDFEHRCLDEARRYYTNVVGKYGNQVQLLLKKLASLDVQMLCPLHGPIWRDNISWFMAKYDLWSRYQPEENGVLIIYASMYGNTENAASVLANRLSDLGVKKLAMYDVSRTSADTILSESFRLSHLVIATTTYNGGIFCHMESALLDMKAHNLQNRTVAVLDNGSWAPTAGRQVRELLATMKNMEALQGGLSIKSTLKKPQLQQLYDMAQELSDSVCKLSAPK